MPNFKTQTEISNRYDLYFILLQRMVEGPGEDHLSEALLRDELTRINMEPFPIPRPGLNDVEFRDAIRFMENLKVLERVGPSGTLLLLTEDGQQLGRELLELLDEDQEAAVEWVTHAE